MSEPEDDPAREPPPPREGPHADEGSHDPSPRPPDAAAVSHVDAGSHEPSHSDPVSHAPPRSHAAAVSHDPLSLAQTAPHPARSMPASFAETVPQPARSADSLAQTAPQPARSAPSMSSVTGHSSELAPARIHGVEGIPYRYVARVLAAIWIAAALLYVAATQFTLTKWQFRGAALAIVLTVLWLTLRNREFRTWLFATTFGQWAAIDRENVREPSQAGTYSRTVLLVLVMVAVSLTIQEYIGDRAYFERTFPVHGKIGKYYELESFAWWSGWRVFGYIGMPVLLLLFLRGEKIAAYHISLRNFFKHLWIYVVLFLCILPAVLYASTTPAFRHTYPFYRLANRSSLDLWMWEGLYAAQFVSLEFFFRGFILQGLRRALGSNAVFVMIVPYCMIHYGKPLPETLGAIGAGLILGTLAMRTRSIWGGVLIHIGVAITMDVLALRGCPTLGSGHFCGD